MKAIGSTQPGLKEVLKLKGLSIEAQDKHALRTTIDQRGEQTIKRDAKVAGGIKKISTCEETALQCFVKLGKMFFISLQKLFSFSRKSNFRILHFQIS